MAEEEIFVMKHLKRNLILGCLALALLIGGYLFAVNWQPTPNTAGDSAPEVKTYPISTLAAAEIKEIQVIRNEISYTITRDNAGTYRLDGLSLNLSPSVLAAQFSALSTFTSTQPPITIGGREADFGLSSPTAVVKLKTDTKEETFRLGTEVPGGEGTYFAPENSDSVYILSSSQTDGILRDLSAQKNTTILTLDPAAVSAFTLKDHNQILFDARDYQEGDKLLNAVSPTWVMTSPYFEGLSTDRFTEFLENFKEVTALSFVEDNVQDIAPFFKTNDLTVSYTTQDGETHTLRLGDTAQDGNIYACLDQNGNIFTVSPSLLSAVKEADPVYFIDKLVALFMLDDIASVEIKNGEKQYRMELTNEDGTETYRLNGVSTDQTAFQQAYKKTAGILFQKMYDGDVTGQPSLQIIYTLKNGQSDTTSYYPLDERNYVAVRSNGTKVLVLKNYLDDIFLLLR